jgi:UPF0755 protein
MKTAMTVVKRKINLKKWLVILGALGLVIVATGGVLFYGYQQNLKPVSSNTKTASVEIASGMSLTEISALLKKQGLIRNEPTFIRYAQLNNAAKYLQAGNYELSPSQSVQEIVSQLTKGKVATKLVTILPGQRLDQIRHALIQQGFSETEVDAALEPAQYENSPVLADKPKGASLEGYLYPDSYQRTTTTKVKTIIQQALARMDSQLTADIRAGLKKQGVSVYQGIIVASIVEKEVVHQSDRRQAAQVFLTRIKTGMQLGSDVTAFYGSELAGEGQDVTYDTPYNTRIHSGLPPTPISNVSQSSLEAVAHPADTDWVFFVAGDDGVTHFSKTVEEHEALTKKYCIKLCQ